MSTEESTWKTDGWALADFCRKLRPSMWRASRALIRSGRRETESVLCTVDEGDYFAFVWCCGLHRRRLKMCPSIWQARRELTHQCKGVEIGHRPRVIVYSYWGGQDINRKPRKTKSVIESLPGRQRLAVSQSPVFEYNDSILFDLIYCRSFLFRLPLFFSRRAQPTFNIAV